MRLHVQPRASRSEVAGMHGTSLKVRVQAPPLEGRANQAVIELLAEVFDVPKCRVEVLSGAGGREKLVLVEGVRLADAQRALGKALTRA